MPYIGDLIGYRPLHGRILDAATSAIGSPRAEVAHTIGYRRRKGTAAMLEQLARDVTGWDAAVVEFFRLLATTQYMNHIRPETVYAPDLRGCAGTALTAASTPRSTPRPTPPTFGTSTAAVANTTSRTWAFSSGASPSSR